MASTVSIQHLGEGYFTEVDALEQDQWSAIIQEFEEANIYQTWSYGVARCGRANISHLVLKQGDRVVAAVQARLVGLPALRLGMAYIRWGPMWKYRSKEEDGVILRQIARAIRNEYAIRRGLLVRLLPPMSVEEQEPYGRILEAEGYELRRGVQGYRTILMDARPTLDELERGFHQKWRKHLQRARKNNLQIVEGSEDELFEALGDVYEEMVDRKQFAGRADIELYRKAQGALPPDEKMTVVLCRAEGEIVAGALFSSLGRTAVDLFRATSNRGVKNYGSYLVQWRVLELLKLRGCHWYDLNGINPVRNPGGYQFKSQLAGKNGHEVDFLGAFETYPNPIIRALAFAGERFRAARKRERESRGRAIGRRHNPPLEPIDGIATSNHGDGIPLATRE